ncbi:hypothetical protein CDAR_308181 [Caerostris darwini]|uniref:Uncharacterized protein n=1 Tax=Caerostris darwini TaxID=1538125 RepID=A0AAV4SED5_9ARAC|nr:hypothetical protein CDAR_308181 [Caerostris darwini]
MKRNAGIARGSPQSPDGNANTLSERGETQLWNRPRISAITQWYEFLRNVVLSERSKFNQRSTDCSESTQTELQRVDIAPLDKGSRWTNGSSRRVLTLKSLNEYSKFRNSTL